MSFSVMSLAPPLGPLSGLSERSARDERSVR